MARGIRRPHESVDYAALVRDYPPPPEYFESAWYDDPDTIEHKQLLRLKERAQQAYRVPFFRRNWDAAGFHPSQIETLEDLWKAPFYTVDDLRKSIEAYPPLGDLGRPGVARLDRRNDARQHLQLPDDGALLDVHPQRMRRDGGAV